MTLPKGYVVDLKVVKDELKKLCIRWDERFLCPVLSSHMHVIATRLPAHPRSGLVDPYTVSRADSPASSAGGHHHHPVPSAPSLGGPPSMAANPYKPEQDSSSGEKVPDATSSSSLSISEPVMEASGPMPSRPSASSGDGTDPDRDPDLIPAEVLLARMQAADSAEGAAHMLGQYSISMQVKRDGARFVFPGSDCVLLPVRHSSSEELARLLALDLVTAMGGMPALKRMGVHRMALGLTESPKQEARFVLEFGSG